MPVISDAIFEAGRTARVAGRPRDENPHRAGSQESLDWLIGYTDGEAEQNSDEAEDEA